MLQDGELVTEGDNLGCEFCPVTEERPNQRGDDAEYRHVVFSEALKTCSDDPREHTLDTCHKSNYTNADGIFGRDTRSRDIMVCSRAEIAGNPMARDEQRLNTCDVSSAPSPGSAE
jgi:hypothetical protein